MLVQTAFIGDFVITTPVISSLNSSFGKDNVYLVARPFAKELTSNKVIEFQKERSKYMNLLKLVVHLNALEPDICIVPHLSATSAIISLLSGAKERVGFEENTLSFLFTKKVRKFGKDLESESQRISRILEPLGLKAGKPEIFVDKHYVEKWRKFLKPFVSRKKVVFAPFSNWQTKSYVYWKELFDFLPDDILFILVGQTKTTGYALKNKNVVDLLNRTTLKDVVAILYISDFFLGVDNGISHIASSLSKPCFVIFGPTVPEFGFFPNFSAYRILQTDLPCRPCSLHGPNTCPRSHFACMKNLKPDFVVREFLDFIKNQIDSMEFSDI
ncbi:MAG: glycosyltransferase family 9 protein [Candidatus Calescibacterium sp.]|nr:glycosyltransferase family 9 protein [Candidatus Calescibacterium sp.]MDW8087111.1 glycosyltransferase family 9 protein [Candidatus Calescibacterium sp.]